MDQKKKDDAFSDIQRGAVCLVGILTRRPRKALRIQVGQQRHGTLDRLLIRAKKMVSLPIGGALFFDGEDDFVDLVGFSWGGEMSVSLCTKFEFPKS